MKVNHLNQLTKLIGELSNPSSISPLYRSMEIGPDGIKACSEYGNIEIALEEKLVDEPCLLATAAVLAVTSSLPDNADIELKLKDKAVIWKAGDAKGKLMIVQQETPIPELSHTEFPWKPDANFPKALKLASAACQAAAVSIGMFGVNIENDNGTLKMASSNSIALATSEVPADNFPKDITKVTLRPPVPAILINILQQCASCTVDINQDGIYVLGDWLVCHLPLSPPLQYDLNETIAKYSSTKDVTKVNLGAVKKFLDRAKALTDKHALATVGLEIENGKLVLKHTGIAAESEEYFLCENLNPTLSYSSVQIPIKVLMVPFQHITSVAFDYLPQGIMVLQGADTAFKYIVGGQA